MEINERILTGFLTRLVSALERGADSLNGIQNALEEMANTERLSYDLDIDSRAKANQLSDETAAMLGQMMPLLSHLGFTPDEDGPDAA